jgi:hypothetical protein
MTEPDEMYGNKPISLLDAGCNWGDLLDLEGELTEEKRRVRDIVRIARDMHGDSGIGVECHVTRRPQNLETVNTYEGATRLPRADPRPRADGDPSIRPIGRVGAQPRGQAWINGNSA